MSRPLAFSLIAALAACTASGADGFFVLSNSAPPMGGACAFTGDPTQPALSQGVVNTASNGYFMAPLLQSRLDVMMGQSPFYKTIEVEGARIDLSGGVTMSYQVLASGSLAPQGTANVPITLIPGSIINSLAGMATGDGIVIQASIKFYGQVGGSEIDASPFVYGVTVSDTDVVVNHGPCPTPGITIRAGDVCNPFQDGVVDCCTEATGALTCPARTM